MSSTDIATFLVVTSLASCYRLLAKCLPGFAALSNNFALPKHFVHFSALLAIILILFCISATIEGYLIWLDTVNFKAIYL